MSTHFFIGYSTKYALTRGIIMVEFEQGVFPNRAYVQPRRVIGEGIRKVTGSHLMGRDAHELLSEAKERARQMAREAAASLNAKIDRLWQLAQEPILVNPLVPVSRRKTLAAKRKAKVLGPARKKTKVKTKRAKRPKRRR
jgi:hypothetical protein